jgi:hypothetical protein
MLVLEARMGSPGFTICPASSLWVAVLILVFKRYARDQRDGDPFLTRIRPKTARYLVQLYAPSFSREVDF